ncbi:MAG: DUF1292 domain-containing protein [Firmicutes bacterium]|nr:DUF1292 domain-containing protein [Bacillota bacterium]
MPIKKDSTTKSSKTKKNESKGQNVELFEGDRVITLNNDEGEAVDFYEIACVDYEGEFYSLLQPVKPMDGIADDEVVIFKLQEDEENEDTDLFLPVGDEKLLEKVFEEFMRKVADEESEE